MSVAAAIVDGDRVLAIRRRDNDKWEPPGGTLELNEEVVEGLRREVIEETGLSIHPGPLTGIYKNMVKGIIALVFRCDHTGSQPHPTAEAAELRWMTPKEVEELLDPAYACRLLDAFSHGQVAIRSHDGERLIELMQDG